MALRLKPVETLRLWIIIDRNPLFLPLSGNPLANITKLWKVALSVPPGGMIRLQLYKAWSTSCGINTPLKEWRR